ncbi:hypothetical protein PTSG_09986 [Salpingoeca rosetta]|uniref:Uncharacterized protein n=1 Tax=Salpingoeca rosetta (strain ATCC 50818 / BSB-021) TaxID=946362 RepID=F2UNQ7_SALR5|nr:uncharacterized protein PTSG_09986 [Salpingoeca rosetta]EGD79262.1 hypothetical protein PTSG_09986 [Salpingoeca rosetta]|eukprot:XP_004989347.1 hypothetical protein PTSG_09986 [Salpingoeca rosetta]
MSTAAAASVNGGGDERSPLIQPRQQPQREANSGILDPELIFRRRVTRSWAISVAIVVCGICLLLAAIIQGAFTPVSSRHNVSDGSHPFTVRVVYLYMFVAGLGVISIISGTNMMRSLSDDSHRSRRKTLMWAAIDFHGTSSAGLALGAVSAVASLIAIVIFQDYDKGKVFQFNINETVGWMVIGSMVLLLLGLFSSAELDSRALMGHFTYRHMASTRAAAVIQGCFALQVLVMAIPLWVTSQLPNVLLVAGIVATMLAGILGLLSTAFILRFVNVDRWPRRACFRTLEHAWGLSVGAHCIGLIATGLHVYFSTQVVYQCLSDEHPHEFRPNCDGNAGVLGGLLPYIFNVVALVMMGITALVTTVRMATLAHDAAMGKFAESDEPAHVTDLARDLRPLGYGRVSQRLAEMDTDELARTCEEVIPGAAAHIQHAQISGFMLDLMLRGTQRPWTACAETVAVLQQLTGKPDLSSTDAARLLAHFHDQA